MHFRARSYDPRLGRFVQKDPEMGRRVRASYVYARNNPVRLTDPSGAQEEEPDTLDPELEHEIAYEFGWLARTIHTHMVGRDSAMRAIASLQRNLVRARQARDRQTIESIQKQLRTLEGSIRSHDAEIATASAKFPQVIEGIKTRELNRAVTEGLLSTDVLTDPKMSGWERITIVAATVAPQGKAAKTASRAARFVRRILRLRHLAPLAALYSRGRWQLHHLISNPIRKAIQQHPVLRRLVERENPIYKWPAKQRGYEAWHRRYDDEVVRWLSQDANKAKGLKEFHRYLNELHKKPWLREKVPYVRLPK